MLCFNFIFCDVQNVLALTGEDKKVTISDQDGNTISQKEIKLELRNLKFSPDGQMVRQSMSKKLYHLFLNYS